MFEPIAQHDRVTKLNQVILDLPDLGTQLRDLDAQLLLHDGRHHGTAPTDQMPEWQDAALDLGTQTGKLLAQYLVVMRQALRRHGRQMFCVDLLGLQLQRQQRQQVVGGVGLVDPLHQERLALPGIGVGLAVRMQGAGKLAIDVAQRLTDFLGRLIAPCLRRPGLGAACLRAPASAFLSAFLLEPGFLCHALLHHFLGVQQQIFGACGVMFIPDLDAEDLLQHGLGKVPLRLPGALARNVAVLVVQGFQSGVIVAAVLQQADHQIHQQLLELGALHPGQPATLRWLTQQFVDEIGHPALARAQFRRERLDLVYHPLGEPRLKVLPFLQHLALGLDFRHQPLETLLRLVQWLALRNHLGQGQFLTWFVVEE